MLNDSFRINSTIHPDKRAASTNAETFFDEFNKYYYDIREGKQPNLPKKLCDPYGFMLLCKDFSVNVKIDKYKKCKAVYEGKGEKDNVTHKYYKGKFTFSQLLHLLYRGFWFDYELAMSIYQLQHNPLYIFQQIMNGRGYIMNRYKPNIKQVGKYMNYASESKISLDENDYIPIPYINRVCDGLSWPCLIHENTHAFFVSKEKVHGWGEGFCVLDDNDNIIDVLKINDSWLTETPLSNRMKFAHKFDEYEPIPYMKVWSLKSAFESAKVLEANSTDGVLLRPCNQNYFTTTWFEWNKNSLIYCCNINNKLTTYNVKRSKPDFYTLEGDVGEVNIREERVNERMWLDDFDIHQFQQILEL